MPQEDIVLTTAVVLAKKKYTEKEEAIAHQLTAPKAKIEVLIPEDMNADDFDVAFSAVSKIYARATLQAQAMFPILGRLLYVAEKNPELWNKKFDKFTDFRIATADKFGVARSTSYDAWDYARRWYEVLPPSDFSTVGRVKIKMISNYIGKGDESKATARKLVEFAKEHTADELDAHMDKTLHTGRGSSTGAFFKIPCNKKQLKVFAEWFGDPKIHAKTGKDKVADILELMIDECQSSNWEADGEELIEQAAEAAQQAEKDGVPVEANA